MPRRRILLTATAVLLLAVTAGASAASLPSGRSSYRNAADYLHDLHALAAADPALVRRVVLPVRSVEGREIEGVEIADQVQADDDGRPAALVVGLTHGREWPSGEVAMEYAMDLVARRHEPRVAALLQRLRTIVVPVSNPDGFVATQSGQPLRRRNCRAVAGDLPDAPCIQRRGVDLNRNYGAYWGGTGAGTTPDQDTYRGSAPWSEPETQAMHALGAGLPLTSVISLHNVAALVLRPPGFRALGQAPDEAGLRRLGDAMAAVTGYRSEPAEDLYEATGALEDWNYAAQGAYAYTIELGESDGDGSFQGRFAAHVTDQYDSAGGGMREALLLAAEEARDPRDHVLLTGRAPAGRTLRLVKRFDTMTSPICAADLAAVSGGCATTSPAYAVPDGLQLTLRVPASGRYRWEVGPSTRPFVARDGAREAWTLQCLGADGTVVASHDVVADRGRRATVDACSPRSTVVVERNPAARLVRIGTVSRTRTRVRAAMTCARSCTVRVSLADRGGRRVAERTRALVPGTARTVTLAAQGASRALQLTVSAHDSVGEQAVARRDLGAVSSR